MRIDDEEPERRQYTWSLSLSRLHLQDRVDGVYSRLAFELRPTRGIELSVYNAYVEEAVNSMLQVGRKIS